MAIIAGRLGSITGPGWAAHIQNFRFDHNIELPDASVLGTGTGTYDDHVLGIKGGTLTCNVLFEAGTAITNYKPGTVIALDGIVLLPDLASDAATKITFGGTIMSADWNQDRRGVSTGSLVIKSNGVVTYAESAP